MAVEVGPGALSSPSSLAFLVEQKECVARWLAEEGIESKRAEAKVAESRSGRFSDWSAVVMSYDVFVSTPKTDGHWLLLTGTTQSKISGTIVRFNEVRVK